MKTNYKQKIFGYFFLIFALFAVGIIVFEQSCERKFKTESLEEKLDAYADMVNTFLVQHSNQTQAMDSLVAIFPPNIRLTLIDRQGGVFYDNVFKDISQLENHAHRTEIVKAEKNTTGTDIRISASNSLEYLYYAKQFSNYYVRVALPYDIQVRHFLQPDNLFLYYIIALFVVMLFLINYVAGRFGKSINQLKNFASSMESSPAGNEKDNFSFPPDELGDIGTKIAENYRQLERGRKEIALEREKLLQHVHSSEEGLCFFSSQKTVGFYNGLFIQYLNTIVDQSNSEPSALFSDRAFDKINSFLYGHKKEDNYFETQINKHGKTFIARINIFEDNSFEIILNDVTTQEKTRLLKQEMTGNIAHELRTPVTSIRGYLELVLEQSLDSEKNHDFLTKAYSQTLVLSELIQDMSLLTKIEEVPQSFQLEPINIPVLIEKLKTDLEIPLKEKGIKMEVNLPENTCVRGNSTLLYSIFRNLTDNVIRYAGNEVTVFINKYNEDADFYYFSYSDTGVGISDEHHLNRLFERFYRVSEGRTRDTGGSGLGLSIVKNAVLFHKGSIAAKNRTGGGLEFLFRLPKNKLKKPN
jgi:signal transduction histidine kinase